MLVGIFPCFRFCPNGKANYKKGGKAMILCQKKITIIRKTIVSKTTIKKTTKIRRITKTKTKTENKMFIQGKVAEIIGGFFVFAVEI